jgi:hypothetical protein
MWFARQLGTNHPMWFQGGWWVADGQRVAKLGGLGELLT